MAMGGVCEAIAEGRTAAAEADAYLNGCTNLVRAV